MKHQPSSPQMKEVFTGPRAEEQKPKLCSRCGKPVVLAYRVYKRHLDKTGEWRIDKGQFEVAHILDNKPVWDVCPYPSLLEQLEMKVASDRAAKENTALESGVTTTKVTVHLGVAAASNSTKIARVSCGARGNLYVTLDSESVTCSNCKVREAAASSSKQQPQPQQTNDSEEVEEEVEGNEQEEGQQSNQSKGNQTMGTKAEEIKAKIAAAKANKAAQGGQSATITAPAVEKDGEGLPIPKAAAKPKVQKVAVQTAKADKTPKVLNLCGDGCGEPCKSRFIPGHDARLHGWIKKLGRGDMALADLAPQVRDGMFKGVKQSAVKDSEGKVTLGGVEPTVTEAEYLEMLKGKGGPAAA